MCGIAGIIVKDKKGISLPHALRSMSQVLKHRGPDGEGFILANTEKVTSHSNELPLYAHHNLSYLPHSPLPSENGSAFLGFMHRRLAIIDLSETGHQPMCDTSNEVWITYNGEIYNYIELRNDLKKLGYSFVSESDTEVILAAYKHWGTSCVQKFNGMWAFCIYDRKKNICFASRDRFGVKPFYYINTPGHFAFASEQKAFIRTQLVPAEMDQEALHNYLLNGLLETQPQNFFKDILELWPGNNLILDLSSFNIQLHRYYHLSEHINLHNEELSDDALINKIAHTFKTSIQLRLRSDVEVGTCLSGGIDSSAIAVTISELKQSPVYCFTSVFRNSSINEEKYADAVTQKILSHHVKVEPRLEEFIRDIETLVYSQDTPIWDTSTYAQYKVMELAKLNGIKVVLDGQGADELFGGYHHHFLAKWNNLFSSGYIVSGLKEIHSSEKSISNPFQFFLKENIKQKKYFQKKHFSLFFQEEFIQSYPLNNPSHYFNDVNQQLLHDIYQTRLKSFLKCEDRCGMWHSVESRTPFSDDIDLINLMFSFNGNRKIKNGVSKFLLREAVKPQLPKEIYNRHDKKGFETPMHQWVQAMRGEILSAIRLADFDFVDVNAIEKTNPDNVFQNKLLFKLFVLCKWRSAFQT